VRLIDGTGSAPQEDMRIDIAGGKITAVQAASAHSPYPPNAKVLGLTGKTVIPGLVGMHEHLFYPTPQQPPGGVALYGEAPDSAPRLYLAGGVTTARTAGSLEPYTDLELKREIDAGLLPGPKLDVTGPYLEGKGTFALQMHALADADDAARTVDYWAAEGVTSFKAYNFLTADELKAAIDATAAYRGVPLVWPSTADLQRSRLDYAAVSGGAPSTLVDTARRASGEGVLVGRANGTSAAANVRWTLLFEDRSSEFSGPLEGVNRAADLYAELFAASGNLVPIDMEVTGIGDLREYANVQTYLESLTFVSHVTVVALTGDTIRFRLVSRGGADSLQRTLALNGRLQPVAAGDIGTLRFQLRR